MQSKSNDRPLVFDALDKLGIERKGRKFRCPNPKHPDHHPSASWFGDGTRWKCPVCGAGGDAFEVVKLDRGCRFPEARTFLGCGTSSLRARGGKCLIAAGRKPPHASTPTTVRMGTWPLLRDGRDAEIQALADLRGWRPNILRICQHLGILRFGVVRGIPFWAVADLSLRTAEARRLDGKLWWDDRKAWAFPGSRKDWPLGLATKAHVDHFRFVLLVEGPPDWIAAVHLLIHADVHDVLPVAMLGAGCRPGPDALAEIGGRDCLIWAQADQAGRKAAITWGQTLRAAGSRVRAWVPFGAGDVDDWLGTDPPPAAIQECLAMGGGPP